MTDRVRLRVDGERVEAESGTSVAAAIANAGRLALRRSVSGEPRGVLCAMGICWECRVAIDGEPHRRACLEAVRDGMEVATGATGAKGVVATGGDPRTAPEAESLTCDVVVVGAGPAGVAAACRAAESGARTLVLDENATAGGQIYRHREGGAIPRRARTWLERLERSLAAVRHGASVFDASYAGETWRVSAAGPGGRLRVAAGAVVLATGARELFLPFPGWTLPGVVGAGGAQALWKSGASMRGRTAVVAGSGPLLFPVAASLAKAGARVAWVAEQAARLRIAGFGAAVVRSPRRLADAARYRAGFRASPYRTGTWIAEAVGGDRLEGVVLTNGRTRRSVACDIAAVSYGLVPNLEIAILLGCARRGDAVRVDGAQWTSVAGVAAAGEVCGVAGVEVALAEGEIAGLSAAGAWREASADGRRLRGARAAGRRFASALERAFAPRAELRALARPETIVCRCEDVPLGRIAGCSGARDAKLSGRAGMGPCQGRVCGPALRFLFGWESDTVRPPIQPVSVGSLAAWEEPA